MLIISYLVLLISVQINGKLYTNCEHFFSLKVVNYLSDVDECAEESHDCLKGISTCSNSPEGSYSCSCLKGYEGDGKNNGSGCVIRSNRKIVIALSKYPFVCQNILFCTVTI